ncbi:MAG: P-loop NTPase family protein [Anaerolineae bacterium]
MHVHDPTAPPIVLPMRRIYIIGLSGCGKATLSHRLAERCGLQHIEIDALNWQPGWQALPRDELRAKVRTVTEAAQDWVIDGNYSAVRELLWQTADTIIWLDYPLWFILWRLWRRTWPRVLRRTELWNGNRETVSNAFLSRDSLFLYVIRVFRKRRRLYAQLFAERANPQATYLRFRSAKETELWLRTVTNVNRAVGAPPNSEP